jgi:serine/threonine protein kinase
MHQGGFAHCDLKPANILMFGDDIKIGDLGFVRARENSESSVQRPLICQTAVYRSPEQLIDDKIEIPKYHNTFSNQQIRKWKNNDLKGEYWAFGILCLDIIYNQPFITYNGTIALYKQFISLAVTDFNEGISMTKTIQNVFGVLDNPIDRQLLKLVATYLLLLNQDFRNLYGFMTEDLFNSRGYVVSKLPFNFPQTELMYRPGGITINDLSILFRWFDTLNNEFQIPMLILSNAMDYIIQHAHLITDRFQIQLFGLVVLWLMEKIYSVRDNSPDMEAYLDYSGNKYTDIEFMTMVNQFERTGFLNYESLYFQLPNMRLAIKGVLIMIDHLEIYIEYITPQNLAMELIKEVNKDDIPKTNGYVNLEVARSKIF